MIIAWLHTQIYSNTPVYTFLKVMSQFLYVVPLKNVFISSYNSTVYVLCFPCFPLLQLHQLTQNLIQKPDDAIEWARTLSLSIFSEFLFLQ